MDPQIASALKWLPLAGGLWYLAKAARVYFDDWREAGPVVFDAGGFPAAKLLGGVFCATLLYLAARWISSPVVWLGVALCIGLVSTAALARRQICENGFWHGFGLIPWIAIEGYCWDEGGELTLSFHEEAALRPTTMTVPPEEVPGLQELLRDRVDLWEADESNLAESDGDERESRTRAKDEDGDQS
jgi:hypothetical protein